MITLDLTSLLFLALATWRVTNMLTDESCPFDACVWIRKHLNIGKVLDCPYCTSVWVAGVMLILWILDGAWYVIVYLLAVSTLTIVIHHIVKTFTAFYFYVFGE